jgi:hypothetical protein
LKNGLWTAPVGGWRGHGACLYPNVYNSIFGRGLE